MDTGKKRIVIAGGSGLIGTACRQLFHSLGYDVLILTRQREVQAGQITWDPASRYIAENVVDGAHAVINLCGLPLPDRRWTKAYKTKLKDSRVVPAAFLAELHRSAAVPPACYIGASAVGIYGDRGSMPLHEADASHADDFVPELVRSWEHAHQQVPASQTIILRIGVVIASDAGFMAKVLPPTRFGMYPCFGRGGQIISWIHIDDLARMFHHVVQTPISPGVYNAVAPGSITQRSLMQQLRSVSGRPGLIFPVPEMALKIVFGEMSTILFESADVRPDKIRESGFTYKLPDISTALRAVL
jgi:uncharacterized protein (TIGR01777 family)